MFQKEIKKLKNGIVEKFHPHKIILFGSYAKGTETETSDIDICIVVSTENKRELKRKISKYIYDKKGLDFNKPVDILIYTEKEWERHVKDNYSFARSILNSGLILFKEKAK